MNQLLVRAIVVFSVCLGCAYTQEQSVPTVRFVLHMSGKSDKLADIAKSDLEVLDNGAKVDSISTLEPAASSPAVFAILVDASSSNIDKVDFIRKTVLDVFDVAMRSPDSRGLVFTFGNSIEGGSTWVSRAGIEYTMQNFNVVHGVSTPLYTAVIQVSNKLGAASGGTVRRLLFVITDGVDNSEGVSRQTAIDAALKAGVTIIPIGLLTPGDEKSGKANLLDLAEATGGNAIIMSGPGNVKKKMNSVLESEYVLSYISPSNAEYHALSVKFAADRKGISVVAPRSYYMH